MATRCLGTNTKTPRLEGNDTAGTHDKTNDNNERYKIQEEEPKSKGLVVTYVG